MATHEWLVMACGAVCRAVAALANAAPTVLCGRVVAAVIRELFGPALTRRLLAAGSWWSLVRAWLLGMLLPVCSIGAIPVARELRRAGLAGGGLRRDRPSGRGPARGMPSVRQPATVDEGIRPMGTTANGR